MSLARIYHTTRSQKDIICEKCRGPIAKGTPFLYYYVGFRSTYKHTRHEGCAPRDSERESSLKAGCYSALEAAHDSLDAMDPATVELDDVETTISDVGDAITEVAEQYREADENFGGGGGTQSAETADELESVAQDLSGWSSYNGDYEEESELSCDDHSDLEETSDDVTLEDAEANLVEARINCEKCREVITAARAEWGDALIEEARTALNDVAI